MHIDNALMPFLWSSLQSYYLLLSNKGITKKNNSAINEHFYRYNNINVCESLLNYLEGGETSGTSDI